MKSDNLKRNDTQPPVISGEFVPTQSVVTVTNLSVTGPYRGDFQVIDEGRVIVGADPDLGPRGILSARALQGYNANGLNTFAVWFATTEQHAPGDFHAGNLGGNYLAYDQAAGTLGLYTPDGAGILMDNDGTFIAGHSDHGHMKWDAVSQSLKIMSGAATMAEIGDDGDAAFTGIITAQGGHITGRMFVDEVLQAGDSDGPAIYLGRFERTNAQNELVESSEIIATDANNLPWFHVTAGGDTTGGGYFALGGQGDYAQRLTYDGSNLVFDGTIYARGGEFTGTVEIIAGGTLVVAGEITFGGGRGKLDATGLKLETSQSGDEGYNEIQWFYDFANNRKVAGIQAESALGHTTLTIETAELYNDDDSVVASTIELVPRSDTGGASSVVLRPTVGGVVDATLTVNNSSVEAVGATSVSINNATTAAVDNLLTLNHNSSGTPAAFFGAGLAVNLKSTTTNSRPASTINTLWATPTHGAETAAVTINTVNGGNLANVAKFGGTLGAVLNEDGNAWNDLRVEGDTDTHLIFVDASADKVGISETAPAATLDVNGTTRLGDHATNYAEFAANGTLSLAGSAVIVHTEKTPANASAAGVKGEICYDSSYIYVCTATNTWKRAAISTW